MRDITKGASAHRRPHLRQALAAAVQICMVFMLILSPLATLQPATVQAAPAKQATTTNTFSLRVVSARTEPNAPGGPVTAGDEITEFQYLINEDNTGDPLQPSDDGCTPERCELPGQLQLAVVA